jgi:hypothetical protein
MPNDNKNPFPDDIPKKSPPHKEVGKEWKWEPSDESKGVNPSTKSEFDNLWYEAGYTDKEFKRSYTGKHLEHEYPHISIHGKSGTLKVKHGYMYRLFDCTITEMTIEGAAIVYCRDCKIDKVTGAASTGYARIHFTNCEVKDIDTVTKCKMVFDRDTIFKPPAGSAQFNSLTDCGVSIFSKPEWTLSNAKQMSGLTDCDVTVSGPSCIHQNSAQAMIENLSNCNFAALGQWLATAEKSGCTQTSGNKIFSGVTDSNILTVNTKINNPDVGGALCEGMSNSNFTSIDPEYVVHATFFAGADSNTASIGGSYENCDIINFHMTDSTSCCVNTELTGAPGAGSMLEVGASDGSSFVMAGGKLEVEDNAAPVFAAKDCSMRFYDCEKVKQIGTTDLFANIENCITRVFFCEEVRSIHERVWNEKKNCRVDVVGNKQIKADDSDIAVIKNNSVLTMKYNEEMIAKLKIAAISDHSAMYTQRNGIMEAENDVALTIEDHSNVNLNSDEKLLSKNGNYSVTLNEHSKLVSRNSYIKGEQSTFAVTIDNESIMESEYDKIESLTHIMQVKNNSKVFSKWQEWETDEHDGIFAFDSYIDFVEGFIKTKGEEFSTKNCKGTIKDVLLLGTKELIFQGGNSIHTFNQTSNYIYMQAKDEIECEKMTNLIDITGADCIFKVREGTCIGNITIANKEVWFHGLTVNGATSIQANICKLFGSNFKALSVTGGQIQTGGNTALGTSYSSALGLLSDDTYTSLSCTGNYIMNKISGGSISVDGLAFYQDCPDMLSLPYKKGVYSSDDLDVYAVNNIKMWAAAGKVEIQAALDILSKAGMNIKEEAGMSIEEKAGLNVKSQAGGMIEEEASGMIKETAGGLAITIAKRILHN